MVNQRLPIADLVDQLTSCLAALRRRNPEHACYFWHVRARARWLTPPCPTRKGMPPAPLTL